MAKTKADQSRRAGRTATHSSASKSDATKKPDTEKPSDEDVLADIVVLRDIVKRLGADRVIDLVKHFR